MAVEEPKFELVSRDGEFEIRDYSSRVVAQVETTGNLREASNSGFRLLAGYIFGGNVNKSAIAMTAPVTQASASGSKIAMTAPVTLQSAESASIVQFTMPSEYALEDLPIPSDKRVQLRELPHERMAVLRFSGLTGDRRVAEHIERLQKYLRENKLVSTGAPSLARYDPPWTLWFMRRNEVMVPVSVV
jgi:hypothetical protein